MSFLATGIATASSGALGNANQSSPSARPDGGLAQTVTTANAVVTGQAAAIVNLSGPASSRRGVTHGAARMVDGSFEGKESKKKEGKEKDGKEADGKKVNVTA